MSETSNLSELARFVGQSKLESDNPEYRRRAVGALAEHYPSRSTARTVTDLLGVVLVLSSRTRRMIMPPVCIDIDVFNPDGGRALRIMMPSAR